VRLWWLASIEFRPAAASKRRVADQSQPVQFLQAIVALLLMLHHETGEQGERDDRDHHPASPAHDQRAGDTGTICVWQLCAGTETCWVIAVLLITLANSAALAADDASAIAIATKRVALAGIRRVFMTSTFLISEACLLDVAAANLLR